MPSRDTAGQPPPLPPRPGKPLQGNAGLHEDLLHPRTSAGGDGGGGAGSAPVIGVGEIVERSLPLAPPPLRAVAVGQSFPQPVHRRGGEGQARGVTIPFPYGRHAKKSISVPTAGGGGADAAAPPPPPPPSVHADPSPTRKYQTAAAGSRVLEPQDTTVRIGQLLTAPGEQHRPLVSGQGGSTHGTQRQWSSTTFYQLWRGSYISSPPPPHSNNSNDEKRNEKAYHGEAFLEEIFLLLRSTVKRHQEMGLEILLQHLVPTTTTTGEDACGGGAMGAGLRKEAVLEAGALRLRLLKEIEAEAMAEEGEGEAEEGGVYFLSVLLALYTNTRRPRVCVLVLTLLNVLFHKATMSVPVAESSLFSCCSCELTQVMTRMGDGDATACRLVHSGAYRMEEEISCTCMAGLGTDPTPFSPSSTSSSLEANADPFFAMMGEEGKGEWDRAPSTASLLHLSLLARMPTSGGAFFSSPFNEDGVAARGPEMQFHPICQLCERLQLTRQLLGNVHVLLGDEKPAQVGGGGDDDDDDGERRAAGWSPLPPAPMREDLLLAALLAAGAGAGSMSRQALVADAGTRWFSGLVETRLGNWVLGLTRDGDDDKNKKTTGAFGSRISLERAMSCCAAERSGVAGAPESNHHGVLFSEDLEGLAALVPLLLLLRRVSCEGEMLHRLIFGHSGEKEEDDRDFRVGLGGEETGLMSTMRETIELFFIRLCSLAIPPTPERNNNNSNNNNEKEVLSDAMMPPHVVVAVLVAFLWLRDFLGGPDDTCSGLETNKKRNNNNIPNNDNNNNTAEAGRPCAPQSRQQALQEIVSARMDAMLEGGLSLGAGLVVEEWLRRAAIHYYPAAPFKEEEGGGGGGGLPSGGGRRRALPPPSLMSFFNQAALIALDGLTSRTTTRRRGGEGGEVDCNISSNNKDNENHNRISAWDYFLNTVNYQLLATYVEVVSAHNEEGAAAGWQVPEGFDARLWSHWLLPTYLYSRSTTTTAEAEAEGRRQQRVVVPHSQYFERFFSSWMDSEAHSFLYAPRACLMPTTSATAHHRQTTGDGASQNNNSEGWKGCPLPPQWVLSQHRHHPFSWVWEAAAGWVLSGMTAEAEEYGVGSSSRLSPPRTALQEDGPSSRLVIGFGAGAAESQLRLLLVLLRRWSVKGGGGDAERQTALWGGGEEGSEEEGGKRRRPAIGGSILRLLGHLSELFVERCLGVANEVPGRLARPELRAAGFALQILLLMMGDDARKEGMSTTSSPLAPLSRRPIHLAGVFLLQAIAKGARGMQGLLPVALHASFFGFERGRGGEEAEEGRTLLLTEMYLGLYHLALGGGGGSDSKVLLTGAARSWMLAPMASWVAQQGHEKQAAATRGEGEKEEEEDEGCCRLRAAYGTALGMWARWVRYVLSLDRRMKDVVDADALLAHLLSLALEQQEEQSRAAAPFLSMNPAAKRAVLDLLVSLMSVCCLLSPPVGEVGSAVTGLSSPALRALTISLSRRAQPNQEAALHPVLYLAITIIVGKTIFGCSSHTSEQREDRQSACRQLGYLLMNSPVEETWVEVEGEGESPPPPPEWAALLEEVRRWRFERPWQPSPHRNASGSVAAAALLPSITWAVEWVQSVAPFFHASPLHSDDVRQTSDAAPSRRVDFLSAYQTAFMHPARGLQRFAVQELTHSLLSAYIYHRYITQRRLTHPSEGGHQHQEEQEDGGGASGTLTPHRGTFRLSAFESEVWRRTLEELQWHPEELIPVLRAAS